MLLVLPAGAKREGPAECDVPPGECDPRGDPEPPATAAARACRCAHTRTESKGQQ
jgi:hypothetical protein